MKSSGVAALVLVASVAAGCGTSGDVGDAEPTTTGPATAPSTATVSTPTATAPTSTTRVTTMTPQPTTTTQPTPAPPVFSIEMVRARGVSKENKGGQSDVRFVAGSTNAQEVEQLALACVAEFVKQTKAAFCYAYGTQSDYDVTEPDWTPEFDESAYGGSRPCWVAYAGQALADSSPSIGVPPDSVSYEVSGCPGGVQFN